MKPLVSVVTPVRNGEAFVHAAIESIRRQTLALFQRARLARRRRQLLRAAEYVVRAVYLRRNQKSPQP